MINPKYFRLLLLIILALALSYPALSQPSGAQILYNQTETKSPAPANFLNTSGGTFTTLLLSSETQNLRWKAYAGNVTGVLTLDDEGNYTIFRWQMTVLSGQVYASRNSSIDWSRVECANETHIRAEEIAMNHTTSNADSINSTFSSGIHRNFYVGTKPITQSSCRSAFTWVNDTPQTPSIDAPFQEVLLYDGSSIIYTTFIDYKTQGFNYKNYDFQMIVAEKGVGGYPATRYYFFMELQ